MPAETLDPELQDAIAEEIDRILQQRGGVTYTPEDQDTLEQLQGQVQSLLHEPNVGRSMTGPLWLSGASVLDGTMTAEKLSVQELDAVNANTGALQVSDSLTAADSYPALTGERILLTPTELQGYNASDDVTFELNIDGSGFLGTGGSQITWTSDGVVTVPNVAISSLTIADIGSGQFDANFDAGTGRVRAGTALERVELTSSGLAAYDTGGTQTFNLDASDGSLTHTGTHTIESASSGARTELSSVGIRAFDSGGSQTFNINSSDGSGYLGVDQLLTFGTSVVIDGDALVDGTLTADKLNVNDLSAVSTDLGTITAGTITAGSIEADTIDSGTLDGNLLGFQSVLTDALDDLGVTTDKLDWSAVETGKIDNLAVTEAKIDDLAVTSAKIDSLEADKITTGTLTSTTISVGSGGRIEWEGGASHIDSSGMVLASAGSSFGDSVRWTSGFTDYGSIAAGSQGMSILSREGIFLDGDALLTSSSAISIGEGSTGTVQITGANGITFVVGSLLAAEIDGSGRFINEGNIFPGGQINEYLTHDGSRIGFGGVDLSSSAGSIERYAEMSFNGLTQKIALYSP